MRSNTKKKRTLFQNYETEYPVLLFTFIIYSFFFFFRFFLFYLKWIDLDNVYDSNILQPK
jgi:hypothetical protein